MVEIDRERIEIGEKKIYHIVQNCKGVIDN